MVVPEIEFPGHCTAALAAYPHLGCRADTLEVPTEEALQACAIQRVQAILRAKGKRLISWLEILEGGLDSTAVIEVWRGDEQAQTARRNGNRMIRALYFSVSPAGLNLEVVERYDPRVDGTDVLVMGAECPAWSEQIAEGSIAHMVFSRLQAFAERRWTGGAPRADPGGRIAPHVERLEGQGWITAREDRDLFHARLRYAPAGKC